MNNSTIAKNGFKTFIWTLAVSLVIFSVIYYIATDSSAQVSVESTEKVSQKIDEQKPQEVAAAATQEQSVFKELSSKQINVPTTAVLGGANTRETTQSTVPGTGTTEITYAFLMSVIAIVLGIYFFIFEPRRKALVNFENRVKRDLD